MREILAKNVVALPGVSFDFFIFLGGEASGLEKYIRGYADLANVMEQCSHAEVSQVLMVRLNLSAKYY